MKSTGAGVHVPGRRRARRACAIGLLAAATVFAAGGCSSSKDAASPRFPPPSESPKPPEPEPVELPSPRTTFSYLAQNDDCRCEEYAAADRKYPVRYRFRATYRMDGGILTSIGIRFENLGADTLHLDPGSVMVSSKNVDYQYNNRFVPLPDLVIPPGDDEEVNLDGKEVTTAPSWKRIAGEKLTLTVKGMRYGENVLGTQTVTFIPENPLLQGRD